MQICTVVARNYLAAARVLARSFHDHHPGGKCWTLIIDDVDHEVDDAAEPFEVIRPEELQIDAWHRMTAGYSVVELSTAVKPWLLRHLLDVSGAERITFLDPDVQIFDSLMEVEELLQSYAVVLNPHLTAPLPRDGHRPAETDILASGSFNLGFAGFAASDEVHAMLGWWAERLATDCLAEPDRGYFVDQRWMDLGPGLIQSMYVLRDPGYNVAYWNLPHREVRHTASGYVVDGRPLRFFHFSGYDPSAPERLSKHQDRIKLVELPAVRQLCDGYAEALRDQDHNRWQATTYGFGALADGTPLDAAARRVYRDAMTSGVLPDEEIFTAAGGRAFHAYLMGPAAHGARYGVTRYLEAVREQRRDVRDSFPDLDGPDGARLVAWANALARTTGAIAPALTPTTETRHLPGMNIAGYFKGVMGVGEHARQLAAALGTQGIPLAMFTLHPEASPEDDRLAAADEQPGQDRFAYFNLVCANADSLPSVAELLGPEFFAERYTIGFWAWEVSAFPDRFIDAFSYLDEVWVGSEHVRDAVAEKATVPVLAIPQPVSLPERSADAQPPSGLPDGFRFLFAFDYLSVFDRKNPLATIDAFTRAFEPGSGASLIVKSLNSDHDPSAHGRLVAAAAAHPDVHLIDQRLPPSERDGLMNAADCYVSLHRAEGFGYTLAEAMWLGKPVVATGYSGNLDYMTPENSYLVANRLVPIGPGRDPYPADGVWAEPDVAHAATLMRDVFEHRDEAARRGTRAAAEIRASHGPEAAGRAMSSRLEVVMASPAWRSDRRGVGRSAAIYTSRIEERIRSGPLPARRRHVAVQRAVRSGLFRLLRPVTAHQRQINEDLLNAVEVVDTDTQSMIRSQKALVGRIEELEAELRRLRAPKD